MTIRIAYLLPLTTAMLLSGCDDRAPIPTKNAAATAKTSEQPITIGYSDWPGWVAWQVAIEKGWFKQAGVNINFKWFDYSASLSAFSANQLDAVMVTNGDNLINTAGGTKGMMIMATDYSAGNDVIIAKPGINTIADLKGKTIATEKGLVDHLLLHTALLDNKMQDSDIKLVNSVTNELPQVFTSPDINAIAVWQPVANQALKAVPGSKIIYSSKDKPGLIYDTLTVNMNHLSTHQAEWKKVMQVWDKTVKYINDPATHQAALTIIANKAGVPANQYEQFLNGAHLLSIQDNKQVFKKSAGFDSIYTSTEHVNQFNMSNGAYKTAVNTDATIDSKLIQQMP